MRSMEVNDEIRVIADRCTAGALAALHKIDDKDIFEFVIEALKRTEGVLTEGTVLVILIRLKDELRRRPDG